MNTWFRCIGSIGSFLAFIHPPGNTFYNFALHVVHIALWVLRYTFHKTGKVQDREAWAGVSPSQASASVLAGELLWGWTQTLIVKMVKCNALIKHLSQLCWKVHYYIYQQSFLFSWAWVWDCGSLSDPGHYGCPVWVASGWWVVTRGLTPLTITSCSSLFRWETQTSDRGLCSHIVTDTRQVRRGLTWKSVTLRAEIIFSRNEAKIFLEKSLVIMVNRFTLLELPRPLIVTSQIAMFINIPSYLHPDGIGT